MNTLMSFLYRDAGNYKVHNEIILDGEITEEQKNKILNSCEGDCFIPEQVGMPFTRFEMITDDDTCFCEIYPDSFSLTDKAPTVTFSISELVSRFEAAGESGWDCEAYSLKPTMNNKEEKNMHDTQIICVINGKGGIGKDTLISSLKGQETVANISSIDLIRDLAEEFLIGVYGNRPAKTLPYRKFLADLKKALDNYNEAIEGIKASTYYMFDKIKRLTWYDVSVLFLHIREPENISEIKAMYNEFDREYGWKSEHGVEFTTLLIKSSRALENYGNSADDNAENYPYDYIYESEGDAEEDAEKFKLFFANIRKELENK